MNAAQNKVMEMDITDSVKRKLIDHRFESAMDHHGRHDKRQHDFPMQKILPFHALDLNWMILGQQYLQHLRKIACELRHNFLMVLKADRDQWFLKSSHLRSQIYRMLRKGYFLVFHGLHNKNFEDYILDKFQPSLLSQKGDWPMLINLNSRPCSGLLVCQC